MACSFFFAYVFADAFTHVKHDIEKPTSPISVSMCIYAGNCIFMHKNKQGYAHWGGINLKTVTCFYR